MNIIGDDTEPLSFVEVTGDHAFTETVRGAIVYAAINKFMKDHQDLWDAVDFTTFTEEEKKLSKHITFHGPITDVEQAMDQAKLRKGILVLPRFLWSEEEDDFAYLAILAN